MIVKGNLNKKLNKIQLKLKIYFALKLKYE